MKPSMVLCIGATLVAMAGCASQPQLTAAEVDGKQVCNADSVSQAEQNARKTNRQVIWGYCPTWTLRPS